jgi:hypothetical protein
VSRSHCADIPSRDDPKSSTYKQRLSLLDPVAGYGPTFPTSLFAPGRELVAELLVLGPGGLVDDVAALENGERGV